MLENVLFIHCQTMALTVTTVFSDSSHCNKITVIIKVKEPTSKPYYFKKEVLVAIMPLFLTAWEEGRPIWCKVRYYICDNTNLEEDSFNNK